MMPEPLNGRKDDRPIPATITGHRFSRLTDRCELTHSLPGGPFATSCFPTSQPLRSLRSTTTPSALCGLGKPI